MTDLTPTATIELGEKTYTLRFTIAAMQRAQDLGVLNVDTTNETAFLLALPAYVWACMDKTARKELDLEAVGELMNPRNMKEIAEAVGGLFKASLPEESTSGNGEPAAEKIPTAGESTSISSGELAVSISGLRSASSGV